MRGAKGGSPAARIAVLRSQLPPAAAAAAGAPAAAARGPVERVLAESPRLRVVDFRLPAGGRAEVRHARPTLRWEVGAADAVPTPRFFDAGAAHHAESPPGAELREIVFELRDAEPRLGEAAVERLTARSAFSPLIGSKLDFENRLCRASALHLPPGGGDPRAIHQHTLDYGLVFVGPTQLKVWTAEPGGEPVHVRDSDVPDGHAVVKTIERGGFGEPSVGYAVHSLTNRSAGSWLRCYQVELK